MTNQEIERLCIDLATSENEEDVVKILEKAGFWDDSSAWVDYDRNPNNFSTIGNQQSSPDAALVEKIINSVDAVLMRECQRRGIKPDSPKAPKNIQEALKEYFNVYDGKLSSIDSSQRSKLAENILLVATGEKSNPCYSIIDFGEGQTPQRMPDTFLSLNKKNKLNIQFVQGKFNMGGTGALQFCSRKHNLQLIISRRDPEIAKNENDETKDKWGFTIVRREDPREGMRSSSFRYLAPSGKVLMFDADDLPLLPGEYPQPYSEKFKYGTFIKLYEYQLPGGLKTSVKFDLYYRIALLLPNIALPITMYERRGGYRADSYHIVMSGLSVRLDEDKSENLEPNFPSSSEMKIMGQEMKVLVYAFKKGKREKYTTNEGIVFTVNGQAHGFIPQRFFDRKSVGMSYLADSILVIVNCSKFERRIQEDLFMNSRDRLRDNPIRYEIESQLEDLIKNHEGLRALREQRRREEIEDKLEDSKPLAEILENIIKKSPSLSKLFLEGVRIRNPLNLVEVKTKTEFKGRRFPTYFKLSKGFPEDKPKIAPIDRRFRVHFETDAENEYFNRDREPGQFSIFFNDHTITDFSLNLWNGLATLTVALPNDVKIDDVLSFRTETTDNSRVEPFYNEFFVKVTEPEEPSNGGHGKRRLPAGEEESEETRKVPSGLSLPNIIRLTKKDERWSLHFKEDQDALSVKDAGEGGYDFFINMDNKFLRTEIKYNTKIDPRLLEARFKYGMVLLGISLLKHSEDEKKKGTEKHNNELSVYDLIFSVSKAISPILLPMIASLGDLELN
ncbi:MAG TPA: hypothetical protein PKY35_12450 [Candidatus Hydrogenedentes bacterium]|nr:hypothetical protein [Candidatus Hydrogenedentota bacterium]HPO87614.1 hypothetical protein [Candidatus Hydrogenedentota bacterium]